MAQGSPCAHPSCNHPPGSRWVNTARTADATLWSWPVVWGSHPLPQGRPHQARTGGRPLCLMAGPSSSPGDRPPPHLASWGLGHARRLLFGGWAGRRLRPPIHVAVSLLHFVTLQTIPQKRSEREPAATAAQAPRDASAPGVQSAGSAAASAAQGKARRGAAGRGGRRRGVRLWTRACLWSAGLLRPRRGLSGLRGLPRGGGDRI